MNANITRTNPLINADEVINLVGWRSKAVPTALVRLTIDGKDWFVMRDGRRHPHLYRACGDTFPLADGTTIPFGRAIVVEDGDKIAFDKAGDVWVLRARVLPFMEAC